MTRQQIQRSILVLVVAGGCSSRAPDADNPTRADTQTVAQPSVPLPAANANEERLTSGTWDPVNPGELPDRRSRFDISADHYVSGRLVLSLDTISPRVMTEDAESIRTLACSLVVTGIASKETWSRRCTDGGRYDGFVIGVIPNAVSGPTVPRLAWQFDTVTYRIRSIRTDSIVCSPETGD